MIKRELLNELKTALAFDIDDKTFPRRREAFEEIDRILNGKAITRRAAPKVAKPVELKAPTQEELFPPPKTPKRITNKAITEVYKGHGNIRFADEKTSDGKDPRSVAWFPMAMAPEGIDIEVVTVRGYIRLVRRPFGQKPNKNGSMVTWGSIGTATAVMWRRI